MVKLENVLEYRSKYNFYPNLTGVKVTELTEEKATAELLITDKHMNPNGVAHGGVLFTLADTVAGVLACSQGLMHTTASGNMEFLRPVQLGETVIAEATYAKKGRKLSFINVEIRNPENKVTNFGTFTYYNLEMPYDQYHKDEESK